MTNKLDGVENTTNILRMKQNFQFRATQGTRIKGKWEVSKQSKALNKVTQNQCDFFDDFFIAKNINEIVKLSID